MNIKNSNYYVDYFTKAWIIPYLSFPNLGNKLLNEEEDDIFFGCIG